MVQKNLPLINSTHGSETRNIINELIKLFNGMGYTYNESLQKAQDILDEAQQTNDMNESVQQQINTLIAESGTSDAEVLQARIDAEGNEYPVLKERLDEKEQNISTQLAETAKVVNARSRGAVGDGETDDWGALQGAIVLAETLNRPLYIPEGTYYVSQTLRTRHQTSYNYRPGITIYGAGKETVLIGDDLRVPADYSTNVNMSDQAILALHGSNNTISKLMIQGGNIGLYIGQDPRTTEGSQVSMNIMEKIWIYYTGTGILYEHGGGNAYNKTRDVHIAHAQIGVHLKKGLFIDGFYNNRNTFDSVRVNRSWIGYLVEDGDGNMFNKVFAEGINDKQSIGDAPSQLPVELNGVACAIVATDGQYNNFTDFAHEAVDWDVYSTGFRYRFTNGMIKDDSLATLKTMFPREDRQPLEYSANSIINSGMTYQFDSDLFFEGPGGFGLKRRAFDIGFHQQRIDLTDLSNEITNMTSSSKSLFQRFGMVSDWHVKARFSVNVLNDPIKIKLPKDEENMLSDIYTRPLTGTEPFSFPVSVGTGSPNTFTVWARFATTDEAVVYGGNHIIIPVPSESGWNQSDNANYLIFSLRYFNENL